MSKFDKYSQYAIGVLFLIILAFFGFKTALNISSQQPAEWSRAVINQYYNDKFENHDDFIDLNGAFHASIGSDIMRDADPNNVVYRLDNGKLTNIMPVYDVTANVKSSLALYEWLSERDIEFLYVIAPNKNSSPTAILPPGVHDYSDVCINGFIKLTAERFPVMDLREEFAAADFDWDEGYFNTDHHWTPAAGLWVSNYLLDYFNKQGAFSTDAYYTDEANYAIDNYEDSFLGSWGRRVGKYFAGVDDFVFVYPAFATDFDVIINKVHSQTERSGDFQKAIIYEPLLIMDDEHIEDNHYGAYFGGDYAEVIIKNNNIADGGKVLMIKDSYSLPVAALMSCGLSELRMLDFRYLKEYDLEAYIEEYQPDAVLVMYSPSVLGANYMHKFLNSSK